MKNRVLTGCERLRASLSASRKRRGLMPRIEAADLAVASGRRGYERGWREGNAAGNQCWLEKLARRKLPTTFNGNAIVAGAEAVVQAFALGEEGKVQLPITHKLVFKRLRKTFQHSTGVKICWDDWELVGDTAL